MDLEMLSRIQFGITIGIHYLFPITTLGLSLLILILESLFLFRRNEQYRRVSIFLVQMLGLVFTVGVATGIVLPFEIGGNWARFSNYAGAVFGPMLSLEATTAFALESAFLSILLFGRNKVSPRVMWFSALCVCLGSHFSAFLIVSANSWLQTPAGFMIANDRIIMTSLREAVINHSTIIRFHHVITAAWLTGAFAACGLAAYYAARKLHGEFTRTLFSVAMPVALAAALLQPLFGHFHCINVVKHNPEKSAAYEGIFHSTNGATLYAFGIPDEKNRTIHLAVGIPYALSFLETGNPFSRVTGLEEFPEDTWPPMNIIFTTFHLMAMLGTLLAGITAFGAWLLWKKTLDKTRWFLLLLPWLIPLPYLANELGWVGAEIGRQPWLIYKVMKTAEATSANLPAWQVGITLAGSTTIYLLLLALTLVFLRRLIIKGPAST